MIKTVAFCLISAALLLTGNWQLFTIFFILTQLLRPHFSSKTFLYHSSSPLSTYILSSCPSFHSGYKPTCWLFSGIAHLFFEATFGDLKKFDFICEQVDYKREIFQHPDGGTLAIDWAGRPLVQTHKVIMIGPGITGGSDAQYIRHLALQAISKGFSVGVLLGRGICGLPITSAKVHSAGAFDDFGFLIETVRKRFPKAFIGGIGTSMGSGILLKYVAESGHDCALDAVVAVATSFNHNISARTIDEYWPYLRIPGIALLKIVQDALKNQLDHLKQWEKELENRGVNLENANRVKRFIEFDDLITAKICGFSGADEYYRATSTHTEIGKVQIPMFAINSLDDPVVTAKGVPYEEFCRNENTVLMTTTNGGHVGWFMGNCKVTRWYPVPCVEFCEAICRRKNNLVYG